jgi:predicted acylesterase/phospholipase RssA
LDRLLDGERLAIEGVTATSAGAMNGAMLTTGLKIDSAAEAKRHLAAFWARTRHSFALNQAPWTFWSVAFTPAANVLSPLYAFTKAMASLVSPYEFNPVGTNSLRATLEDLIVFSKVCRTDPPQLFVCATNVQSGRAKAFHAEEISVEALLASVCLPFLYQACRGTRVVFGFDAYPVCPLRDFVILAEFTGFWVPFRGIWANSSCNHVREIGLGSTPGRTRRFKLWTIAFMPTWNCAFA